MGADYGFPEEACCACGRDRPQCVDNDKWHNRYKGTCALLVEYKATAATARRAPAGVDARAGLRLSRARAVCACAKQAGGGGGGGGGGGRVG